MRCGRRCAPVFLAATVLAGSGCATNEYLANRGRDAADVITLAVGGGAGVRLRVGPLHAGLIAGLGSVGLRGGDFTGNVDDGEMEALLLAVYYEQDDVIFCGERFTLEDNRGKGYHALSHLPMVTTDFHGDGRCPLHPYYTQIEVQGGVLIVPRIGFNIGEFVDFLLGWMNMDVFRDDSAGWVSGR